MCIKLFIFLPFFLLNQSSIRLEYLPFLARAVESSRPTLSQLLNFKIRSKTFLNKINIATQLFLEVLKFWKGRSGFAPCINRAWIDWRLLLPETTFRIFLLCSMSSAWRLETDSSSPSKTPKGFSMHMLHGTRSSSRDAIDKFIIPQCSHPKQIMIFATKGHGCWIIESQL